MRWLKDHIHFKGNECLTWPFGRRPDGSAQIATESGNTNASRIMCILAHGEPPSARHEAAHSCGKAHLACVSPDHLRWALPKENAADRLLHGTHSRGERNASSRLTEADVLEIRKMQNVPLRVIAAKYGIGVATASQARSGRYWAWLKEETDAKA